MKTSTDRWINGDMIFVTGGKGYAVDKSLRTVCTGNVIEPAQSERAIPQRLKVAVESCPGYEGCPAPLCPLCSSLPLAIWYASEPICESRLHRPSWKKTQKRIARVGAEGYFTAEMLESIKRVGKGIKGLDPNKVIATDDEE